MNISKIGGRQLIMNAQYTSIQQKSLSPSFLYSNQGFPNYVRIIHFITRRISQLGTLMIAVILRLHFSHIYSGDCTSQISPLCVLVETVSMVAVFTTWQEGSLVLFCQIIFPVLKVKGFQVLSNKEAYRTLFQPLLDIENP